ncbi:MAG: hypothetical protein WC468_02235 [Candidatus Paceibacterota bacterium]
MGETIHMFFFRIPLIPLQGKDYVIIKGYDVVLTIIELQKNFPEVVIDKRTPIVHLPFCGLAKRENGCFQCGSFGECVLEGGKNYPIAECPMERMMPIGSPLFARNLPKEYVFVPIYVGEDRYICAEEQGYKNLINRGLCNHCHKTVYEHQFPSNTTEGWLCPHCHKPVTLEIFGQKKVQGTKAIFVQTH